MPLIPLPDPNLLSPPTTSSVTQTETSSSPPTMAATTASDSNTITSTNLDLHAYSDADWAGDANIAVQPQLISSFLVKHQSVGLLRNKRLLLPHLLKQNTGILSNYSDFGNFNDMLSRTQLADAINSRRTITVLAVDNGNVSPLNGLSSDVQKRVLSLHVILDYYDLAKLQRLSKKSAILTTLYQSTGQAGGKEGFLNVTDMGGDQVAFGSAVAGSSLNANLVQSVTAQPYNISVLQVSSLIMPESVTKSNTSTKTPPPAKAPAPSKAKPPAPASDMAPAPADADSPHS
ncbi:hypothetical protein GH714_033134 [Hevea brasiliensis]|uniref:FAS1 domain-containing protein n=1 Tax=Hevea brasiliensis TaxID=3981 RepID=A0A6A6NE12_HEVBR|nr:hypothetical protein GH714_033134 [Hevea brasiliensis]